MRGARVKPDSPFDRGFTSIEELKSRCEAETGFAPPEAPVFRRGGGAGAHGDAGRAGRANVAASAETGGA